MPRYLDSLLERTPRSKVTLLSGPRQVGKTTLVRELFADFEYLNWDDLDQRRIILDHSWLRTAPGVIFDELPKMPRWKAWLKGICDAGKDKQRFVVTGSARLNTYREVGDSLAGRFFAYTLHPFDLQEAGNWPANESSEKILARLMLVGGFPEPFLTGAETFYKMWRKSHIEIVLKQDLVDLKTVQELSKIELLMEHLRRAVGAPISFNSISEDLQVSDHTVRAWVQLLEDLYVIFRVTPYSRNVKRAILKAPKIYFYDTPLVASAHDGAVFENLIAAALLKELDFRNDSGLGDYELTYLRNKDGDEIDFLILKDRKPKLMIEVKISDSSPSKHFRTLGQGLGEVTAIQLVRDVSRERDFPFGVSIRNAAHWLRRIGENL